MKNIIFTGSNSLVFGLISSATLALLSCTYLFIFGWDYYFGASILIYTAIAPAIVLFFYIMLKEKETE